MSISSTNSTVSSSSISNTGSTSSTRALVELLALGALVAAGALVALGTYSSSTGSNVLRIGAGSIILYNICNLVLLLFNVGIKNMK